MEQYLGLSLVTAICFQFPYADTISTVKYDSISSMCLAYRRYVIAASRFTNISQFLLYVT